MRRKRDSLYKVMTNENKKMSLMNFRLREDVRENFHIAAYLEGTDASNLLHQFVVQTVQAVKKKHTDEEWEVARQEVEKAKESQARKVEGLKHARKKKRVNGK